MKKTLTRTTGDGRREYLCLGLLLGGHQLNFVSLLLRGGAVHVQQQLHLLLALLRLPRVRAGEHRERGGEKAKGSRAREFQIE